MPIIFLFSKIGLSKVNIYFFTFFIEVLFLIFLADVFKNFFGTFSDRVTLVKHDSFFFHPILLI